ncbi:MULTISPECIES: TIGR00730 family Rossman fold protein [Sphingomonadales]|uniref:Cytokinin riboside 5'-monophosphate phosphoribohydrolase n=2 Tax=Edaphosphingomonas TaxID=3423724 RepID=A0A2T4I7X5_9SPHN|nr:MULTISPECIES: TIGR00730 family Rossman fold protein [Sphingomonas]AGH49294.1 putative nucleotide-binding protein [Sphingomonas sp. MM-1]MDX3886206.1 TIGR00730 family Rossman fold protein [Sphingomonas sp.]OHT21931.1 LOG family protein YvdD [Sphingomonas haloaromaticamans]PTD27571.1 TIGR00730 family Rossman fold protein [Sphingomonas fennica]
MKRLAVYCASSLGNDPIFADVARHVGRTLAARGIGLVYGGGRLGLMGLVADAALEAGGEVIGVIPEVLRDAEVAHTGCTELHIVANMHQRKAMMTDLADGFVTIPGGIGTMDELFEALSWAQLGYHAKPCGLVNVAGFYDHLTAFLDGVVAAGLLRPAHRANLVEAGTIEELLDKFADHKIAPSVVQMVRRDL